MFRFLFKLIFSVVIVVAIFLAYGLLLPVGPHSQQLVQLRPGSSARRVAAELKQAGIIRSQYVFLLWHYARGNKTLKAGEYAFEHPASGREVYDRIARGDIYFHTVVVPEGFNIFDIAAAIDAAGLGRREDFLQVAKTQTVWVRDLDPKAPSLEGYLFPDTYHFTRTQSMHDFAAAMVHRFRQAIHEMGLKGDLHSIVTLASIVEKETAVPDERPVVASVFRNRMARNMVLATDPTVIYAALLNNRYRGTIYQSDLQFNSPYNTYKTSGLPPGPICNPGRASLQAATHPTETDYLYFVSDNQGHHRFARTEREHLSNVAAYRHALAQQDR
jgi:UPF0755 protein